MRFWAQITWTVLGGLLLILPINIAQKLYWPLIFSGQEINIVLSWIMLAMFFAGILVILFFGLFRAWGHWTMESFVTLHYLKTNRHVSIFNLPAVSWYLWLDAHGRNRDHA
jgi:hypothetical protein